MVKGRAPKTGYARSKFGIPWRDVDGNGCSTRNDVLAASLRDIRRVGCRVVSGYLDDPYTGTTVPQGFRTIEIDHMVALSDAWQKGAQQWDASKRERFANDPLNLQPTLPRVNSQKSDSDAASWLPSNRSYRCQYVARLIAVKKKYGLWVTSAERAAMERVLGTCPAEPLPARPR